jgi:hypothetical protein
MISAMPPLTIVHVVISLIGILSGFVVAFGLIGGKRLDGWTAIFLLTTVLTSVTGFIFFPLNPFLPSHVVGIISLVVLLVAILARYSFHLSGAWRRIYVITAMIAFYLNFFVLIIQIFKKTPALKGFAPPDPKPPFLIAQVAALLLFVVLTIYAVIRFQNEPPSRRD